MKLRLFVAAALLAVAALAAVGGAEVNQIPCRDPRGCPDLVVDGSQMYAGIQRTETFGATSCAVQEGYVAAGARQLIRLTFAGANVGDGDVKLGNPSTQPQWFTWQACHRHYHLNGWADYRLWTPTGFLAWNELRTANPDLTADEVLAAHPEFAAERVAGFKAGFCNIDVAPANQAWGMGAVTVPDPLPKYGNCNTNQGVSKGWADIYDFMLTGQWIDVTGVPSGVYVLEGEVNPDRVITEKSYANNRAFVPDVVVEQL